MAESILRHTERAAGSLQALASSARCVFCRAPVDPEQAWRCEEADEIEWACRPCADEHLRDEP